MMRRAGRAVLALVAIGFGCAAFIYLTLPDVRPLRTSNPESTAFIDLRAREARAKDTQPKRIQRWVPYGRISANLTRAVLVTEDSRFWTHEGIDLDELKESIETNIERMEFSRGGSTITQQLAKNLYLSPSKNPVRKLRELLIARHLEAELSKQRILELYLNVVEWGDGIYGAEAAARSYFRKSAADLSPSESALLAAALSQREASESGPPDSSPPSTPGHGDAADGGGYAASSGGGPGHHGAFARQRSRFRRSRKSSVLRPHFRGPPWPGRTNLAESRLVSRKIRKPKDLCY